MTRLTYEIVNGKARWDHRTLSEWVPDATRRIARRFKPARIILFGSVASGQDAPDSDLDLLVVFDRIEGRRRDLATAIQHELSDIGAPVDILVVDRGELTRRGHVPGVLRVALHEGRVVYERAA